MYYLILLQQLIASSTHIIAKNVLGSVSAPVLLLIRASIASFSFIIFILLKREKIIRISQRDILVFIVLGILNIPLNQFLFFASLKHTTAPNVALAYALSPAFVLIISIIFLKKGITWKKTIGIAIAFAGTLLVLFEKGLDVRSDNFTGNCLALLASISWGIYTVMGQRFALKYGAVFSTALAMIIGLLFFIPVFIFTGEEFAISNITGFEWGQIVYLGVVTSGVAYVIWYYALKKLEASKVAVFNNLQPVLTTIFAMFLFGQEISAQFIIGGVFTIGGVYLTQKG